MSVTSTEMDEKGGLGVYDVGGANGDIKPVTKKVIDAGMRNLDHYASRLPKWRYDLRNRLIPIVRLETPYLALVQEKMRSPLLDSYFAITANLGTHTFFMAGLPVLFWCGYTAWGRAMVNMLAQGVFWSGVVKDLLCLPRPLSPPLQRITMSGSTALEYGFPSTHSTNAISVVVYVLHALRNTPSADRTMFHTVAQVAFCWYAISIMLGRLYCGMHGFFDVVIGGALGAIIAAGQIMYGDTYDIWITGGTFIKPLLLTLFILVLVRVHPEPADNCPCFDDSVAFAAVVIGVEAGVWHFASTRFSWNDPVPGTAPFDLETLGWFRAILRIILGVLIVFAWRGIMKPTLLRTLPPLFRVVESVGADLPRKFFLKASEYSRVPNLKKDDNIIPPAFDIPSILTMKLRNPLRRRAVSIGPQSEADAWETIAYRHKRRRESLEKLPKIITTEDSQSTGSQRRQPSPNGYAIIEDGINNSLNPSSAKHKRVETPTQINLPTPISSRVQSYEKMMGSTGPEAFPDFYDPPLTPPTLPADHGVYTPNGSALGIGVRKNSDPLDDGLALTATKSQDPGFGGPLVKTTTESSRSGEVTKLQGVREDDFDAEAEEEREQEIEREAEREIFERVERPRVRYDVEVVTKLIVYAGIAWLAVEGNPILFELLGLGMGTWSWVSPR